LNLTVGGAAPQNPNADVYVDGYVGADDCDDGDPQSNPGAFDIPSNQIDEDCSGMADDEPQDCDVAPPWTVTVMPAWQQKRRGCAVSPPTRGGKAKTWGVLAARFVFPDGSEKSVVDASELELCNTLETPPHAMSHGVLLT